MLLQRAGLARAKLTVAIPLLVIGLLSGVTSEASGVEEWWQQPVRMLRVDEVPDFTKLKQVDLEQLARSRKEVWGINCEWLLGSFGWEGKGHLTSFQTPLFERWPGLGDFDYLRSYTPHAHKYGIHVIAYLNMHWFTDELADAHPGWEQLTGSGKAYGRLHPLYGKGTTFCVNGPWRDWAFSMIREAMKTGIDGVFLDGPVIFPDCCYCEACQQLFRQQYKKGILLEDWTDPSWRDFLDFREDSMARFLADAQKAVREVRPDGVVFLNAGSWHPDGWRVARDIQKTGPYQNFNGAEAFFHHGTATSRYECLMTGKYLRAGQIPAVVFTHYMNGSWHYRLMEPNEMLLDLSQTVAAGANPWMALIHSSLESQPQAAKPVKALFDFLEANKAYYTGMESAAQVALLFSTATGRNYLSRSESLQYASGPGKEQNLIFTQELRKAGNLSARKAECEKLLEDACQGYFEVLTRRHIPFDIVLDQDLTSAKLARYKALVLPDGACLSPASAKAIREFVANGGSLLASFEAGFYDERGEPTPALLDLLGIATLEGAFPVATGDNYLEAMAGHWGFKTGTLLERGPHALKVKAREGVQTPERFQEAMERPYEALKGLSPYPAALVSTAGKGKVIYFPEAMGEFYGRLRMPTAEERIAGALEELVGTPALEISAPKTVSVDVYRKKGARTMVLHLVNTTTDGQPATEVLPVFAITIRLRMEHPPAKVKALRENKRLKTSYAGGVLEIRVPQLQMYEVIAIEVR
jgi:hypothetical protein